MDTFDASSMSRAVSRRTLCWRVSYHHAKLRRWCAAREVTWTLRNRIAIWWIAFDLATS